MLMVIISFLLILPLFDWLFACILNTRVTHWSIDWFTQSLSDHLPLSLSLSNDKCPIYEGGVHSLSCFNGQIHHSLVVHRWCSTSRICSYCNDGHFILVALAPFLSVWLKRIIWLAVCLPGKWLRRRRKKCKKKLTPGSISNSYQITFRVKGLRPLSLSSCLSVPGRMGIGRVTSGQYQLDAHSLLSPGSLDLRVVSLSGLF